MQLVSILIPVFQERDFVSGCLESVLSFRLPQDCEIEVMVIDGMSTDGTRESVTEFARRDSRVHLIDNPARYQSAGLNRAIMSTAGEYIMRLDAHSLYPNDYLASCLETARRTGADNTGGIVKTMRRGNAYQASLVQALITHSFGVGNSGFRVASPEGPADTVPYGFFKRELFDRVGLFDERLVRAQDYEMNRRIIAAGAKIWRNPKIEIAYFPQPDFRSFIRKQLIYEAPYNAYMWYLAPYSFAVRHAITAVFAAGIIAGLLLSPFSQVIRTMFYATMAVYFVLAVLSALQQAARYKEVRHLFVLPPAFFLYHFLHGLGVIGGLVQLAAGIAPVQKKREPWTGAGRLRAWPVSPPTGVAS